MSKETVATIDDGFRYLFADDRSVSGVSWSKRGHHVQIDCDGGIACINSATGSGIGKNELKQLMIMWLALNYPNVLVYED